MKRHLAVVVWTRRLRDLLRKRHWLRCWECSERFGPYLSYDEALADHGDFERRQCPEFVISEQSLA